MEPNPLKSQSTSKSNFFELVYEVTLLIPEGRVTSYGAIARYLGASRSARMVGWALNGSHTKPSFIPAHRVVNRVGLLTGQHHFPGCDTMQQMLEAEGVLVENSKVIDYQKHFWDPATELLL